MAAGLPFPAGALIQVKASADSQPRFLAAAWPRLEQITALRRLYLTRYQVEDAREKMLAVYAYDQAEGVDGAINNALISAAAEISLADPMQIIWLDDVPEDFRATVLADVAPCYVRADLREPSG